MLFAGVALLVVGVVLFFAFVVAASQAAADLMNCLNTTPTYPMYGYPGTCANAMSTMWIDQAMEGVGGIMALVGFVLLILGFILEPQRPTPFAVPYYPPPVYAPPPSYTPPQGPQPPPPP